MFGVENQTKPQKYLPFRVFGYEGANYKEQFGSNKHYPVVTIILYFGTDRHWRYSKNLKKLLDIPKEIDEYVNDFKINVFEVAWLSDEVISKFTSDFKIIANYFVNRRKNKDYIPNDKTIITHVDALLKLLSVATDDRRYENILCDKEEKINMCEVYDRVYNNGFNSGMEQGIEQGIERGSILERQNLKAIIDQMMAEGHSREEIADAIIAQIS